MILIKIMSWKRQDAFPVNTTIGKVESNKKEGPYKHLIGNEMIFKRVETEVLQADMIESSLLIINNKDMMVTSNRFNLHTNDNHISVPPAGAIKINNACKIDSSNVHITGNLLLDKSFNTSVMLRKVKKISMDDENSFFLDPINFTQANHFVLDCSKNDSKGMLILPPYQEYSTEWSPSNLEYLYIINLYVNASVNALVDIDIILKEQDTIVKLHSRNSSLSLMWLPEGRWIIHSLGYKTSITYDK